MASSHRIGRGWPAGVLAVLLTAVLSLVGVSTASAAVWGPLTELTSTLGYANGVSCSSAGNCTAVGVDQNGPDATDETGGTWGTPIELTSSTASAFLEAVSCESAGYCTAIGDDSNGHLDSVTKTGGVWGTVVALSGISAANQPLGISCTAAGSCTAVGQDSFQMPFYVTETNGVWGTPTQLTGTGSRGSLTSISCISTGNCTAVGQDSSNLPFYVTETSGAWGTPTELTNISGGSGALATISCTSAGDCTAVGHDGNYHALYVAETGGVWGTPTDLSGVPGVNGSLTSISCTSAGNCDAVGQDGNSQPFHVTEIGGVWGTPIELPVDSVGQAILVSISCSSTTDCTAVGNSSSFRPVYVEKTPDPTATALSCSPGSATVGQALACTATVTDTAAADPVAPTGTVTFSTPTAGSFTPTDSCTLTPSGPATAACSVSFTPSAAGDDAITASYADDLQHQASHTSRPLSVSAASSATSTPPAAPAPPVTISGPRCPPTNGALDPDGRLGPIALGMTRRQITQALPAGQTTRYGFWRSCLAGGPGRIRAGFPSARLLHTLDAAEASALRGHAIMVLTANRAYALDHLSPGSSVQTARGLLSRAARIRVGANTWYLLLGRHQTGVLKTRRGTICEIGLADRALTRTPTARHRLLSDFR